MVYAYKSVNFYENIVRGTASDMWQEITVRANTFVC